MKVRTYSDAEVGKEINLINHNDTFSLKIE